MVASPMAAQSRVFSPLAQYAQVGRTSSVYGARTALHELIVLIMYTKPQCTHVKEET